MSRIGVAATAGCVFSLVTGCASLPALGPIGASAPGSDTAANLQAGRRLPVRLSADIPKDRITSDTRALAAEGLRALQAGKLDEASTLFNTALRLDLANANLQFMNAFTYHLMALGGDAQKFDLAEQGYGLAYKFDPTNAVPLYYQGLAFLDQRKYADAKAVLAQAATMDESDAEMLYDLARAAYLSGDPRTAAAALRKLSGMKQSTVDRGKLLRASVVTNAALGDDRAARAQLDEFRALKTSPETADYLAKRVIEWQRVLADTATTAPTRADAPKPELLAQSLPRSSGTPTIPGASPRPPAPGTPAPGSGPGAP